MPLTPTPTGALRAEEPSVFETGPDNPAFQRLREQSHPAKGNSWNGRIFGLLLMVIGAAGWWYNWHLAATTGQFYIKLSLLGPLALGGGLLVMLRPGWAGPLRSDSTRAHKAALISLIVWMAVASGIDMFLLLGRRSPQKAVTPWSPKLGTPAGRVAPNLVFLKQTYRLGSFNQRHNATWEFVAAGESIDDWKSLLTIIDRPDARTRAELDRLSEGIMSAYKSRGGQILAAKTINDDSGAVYNYMMAAFEEPDKQRFELNFVKVALGVKNAVVVIHGARVTDSQDYRARAKDFLNRNSGEVGYALGKLTLPDVTQLPRRAF